LAYAPYSSWELWGKTGQTGGVASAAPGANNAYYVPFSVVEETVFEKMGWFNGNTVNGNVDAGVYESLSPYALIDSTGTVAQTGTSTFQTAAFSGGDLTLKPGMYHMAIILSGTGTLFRLNDTNIGYAYGLCGYMSEAVGSFGLPANANWVPQQSTGFIPLIGISMKGIGW
jgi:hypothetical protein